jgi:two-component system response regulator RegA
MVVGEPLRAIQTVLAVDDDESVLTALARTIGRQRTVFTASDATSATKLARCEQPDLAIVDLRLGSSSGLDLVRTLKEESPGTVIALVSGYLSIELTVVAVRAGADFVISKPVTGREILRRVEGGGETPSLDETPTLAAALSEHVARVISDCHGNVSEAARRLGICRSSLQRRLRRQPPRS